MHRFTATVVDAKYGDEVWSGVVEAPCREMAETEAIAEWEAEVLCGYEPGHYKAAVVLATPVRVEIARV